MERSCSAIVVLFVRTSYKTSTRSGNFLASSKSSSGQGLPWNVDTKTGSWKFLVPGFELIQVVRLFGFILLLLLEFSSLFIIHVWRFVIVLFHRQDCSHYRQASPRSSRPKSIGFLAFVGPWPPARTESYQTLHFTRSYIATRTKNKAQNPQHKQTRQRIYKAVTTAGGSTCMNAIFKLSITLLTSS